MTGAVQCNPMIYYVPYIYHFKIICQPLSHIVYKLVTIKKRSGFPSFLTNSQQNFNEFTTDI